MFSLKEGLEKKPNKTNKQKNTYNFNGKIDLGKAKTILLFIFLFCFVIFIIWWGFFRDDSEYTDIKHYKNRTIVFTQTTKTVSNITSIVPYINIETIEIEDLNREISELSNTYLANRKNKVEYTYDISGDILSLVLRIIDNSKADPLVYFRTYNINLETTNIITNEEILSLYNLTEENVSKVIENRFKYFYTEENDQDIFGGECDYECFLFLRGITNYLDNTYYYIEDSELYVFKEFKVYSFYDEAEYFKESDFKIKIGD